MRVHGLLWVRHICVEVPHNTYIRNHGTLLITPSHSFIPLTQGKKEKGKEGRKKEERGGEEGRRIEKLLIRYHLAPPTKPTSDFLHQKDARDDSASNEIGLVALPALV